MASSMSLFKYTPSEQCQNSNKRKVHPVSPYPAPAPNGFLAARFPETTPPATPEERQSSSGYDCPTSSVGTYDSDVLNQLFSPFTTPSQMDSADDKTISSSPIRTGKMSVRLVVKQTKKSGVMKKKFAEGLASLYDDVGSSLQSPLWKNATPVTSTTPIPGRSEKTIKPVHDVKSEVTVRLPWENIYERHERDTAIDIDTLWIGTSQFLTEHCFNLQMDHCHQLVALKEYRKSLVIQISKKPYHPAHHLDLARVTNKLGFSDIGAATAYRALVLIEAGLKFRKATYPINLGKQVRQALGEKGNGFNSLLTVYDELNSMHVKTYRELLQGLLHCAAFWDGMLVAKEALKVFPKDAEILDYNDKLAQGFKDRHNILKEFGMKPKKIVEVSRMGKIYQKPYPWMDGEAFKRTDEQREEFNQDLDQRKTLDIACVYPVESRKSSYMSGTDNIPLGIFALKNFDEGDMIMVDETIINMSDVPSSKLQHCDACHASLIPPFMHPDEIIIPPCCGQVAFCSKNCYQVASRGYHRVVCGKDIGWLYPNSAGHAISKKRSDTLWRARIFLRLMCIILSDRYDDDSNPFHERCHPMMHPVVNRMTANYGNNNDLHPDRCSDWQFHDNVVIPQRVLETLGVDIYTAQDFNPEVIQTIYWRIENNANMSTVNISLTTAPQRTSSSDDLTSSSSAGTQGAVNMVCLNPNYLFFNHSCEPNVSWHGAVPDPFVGIDWLRGMKGEILRPGCSAVFCKASNKIERGEQLFISYVGNPMGDSKGDRKAKRGALEKWFEGGCGCAVCEKENREAERKVMREAMDEDHELQEELARKLRAVI